MSVCGIIAEYNPFHNGHLYQLERAHEFADDVIVVMSGNFVQRGEPAFQNKFLRAETAVRLGAGLVIELPFMYSCGSAGLFAEGAVKLLHFSGICDCLCFGSECGDLDALKTFARVISSESPELSRAVKARLNCGASYMRARSEAVREVFGLEYPNSPNDLLAVEYLAALARLGSDIKPAPVKRVGEYHSDELGHMASASAIRRAVWEHGPGAAEQCVPPESFEAISRAHENGELNRLENCFPALRYLLAAKGADELRDIYAVEDGLENRLKKAADAGNMAEMIHAVKSKRYSYTAISRLMMYILAGFTKEMGATRPENIRVLAVSKDKTDLLARLSRESAWPLVTGPSAYDARLTDIYNALTKRGGEAGAEYRRRFGVV